MIRMISRVKPILAAISLLAMTGAANADPTFMALQAQAPPVRPGLARVWFLEQFIPSESLAMPSISANGAPIGQSVPGTVFIRDFPPGTYTFSVPSEGVDSNQTATVRLATRSETFIEVQSLRSWASCGDNCARDTLYVREISRLWAEKYLPTLFYRRVG
ncbi:MAG TPA: hypothetical protein VGR91_15280 [Stellaceae bacterium]|nr:hypothetical protein [Stellaceae bacterium]